MFIQPHNAAYHRAILGLIDKLPSKLSKDDKEKHLAKLAREKDQNSKTVQSDLTSVKRLLKSLWDNHTKPGTAVKGTTHWDLFDHGSSVIKEKFLQEINYSGPETEDDSEADDDDSQSQYVNQSDVNTAGSHGVSRKRRRDEQRADDAEEDDDDSTYTFKAEGTPTKESAAPKKRAVSPGIGESTRRQPSVLPSNRTVHEEACLAKASTNFEHLHSPEKYLEQRQTRLKIRSNRDAQSEVAHPDLINNISDSSIDHKHIVHTQMNQAYDRPTSPKSQKYNLTSPKNPAYSPTSPKHSSASPIYYSASSSYDYIPPDLSTGAVQDPGANIRSQALIAAEKPDSQDIKVPEAKRTRALAADKEHIPTPRQSLPRYDSEQLQAIFGRLRGEIEQIVTPLVGELFSTRGDSRSFRPNPSAHLNRLYQIATQTTNEIELRYRVGEWCSSKAFIGLGCKPVLRILIAAAIEGLVMRRNTHEPWGPPRKAFEGLGGYERYMTVAYSRQRFDVEQALHDVHLARADEEVPPRQIQDYALILAMELVTILEEHIEHITVGFEHKQRQEVRRRLDGRFKDELQQIFLQALRLKERILATCPGAQLTFYWGHNFNAGRMQEEGVSSAQSQSAGGYVISTIMPGLEYSGDVSEGDPPRPLVKAVVFIDPKSRAGALARWNQ